LPAPIGRPIVGVWVGAVAGVGVCAVVGDGVRAVVGFDGSAGVGLGVCAIVEVGAGFAVRGLAAFGFDRRAAFGVCVPAFAVCRAAFVRRRDVAFAVVRRDAAFAAVRRDAAFPATRRGDAFALAFVAAFLAVRLAFVLVGLRGRAGCSSRVMAGCLAELSFHTSAARPSVERMSAFRMSPVGMSPRGMVGIEPPDDRMWLRIRPGGRERAQVRKMRQTLLPICTSRWPQR
jgi:hypothetical protein